MSCSPFDIRDYFLGELPESSRPLMEAHLKLCGACRDEVERLRVTQSALLSFSDEELPQRIRFVSDKVFEPSPLRRWLNGFWNSGARLGFASAALLTVALLVTALHRPTTVIREIVQSPAPIQQASQTTSGIGQQQLDEAVRTAVAEAESRQEQRTQALLAATEKRHELDTQAISLQVEENIGVMRKMLNRYIVASAQMGGNQ